MLAHPVAASLPFVAALWVWHAEGPYEEALANPYVHGLEHACFLATALLSWAAVLAPPRRRAAVPGMAVLVLFGLAMVSGLLGVLLTFAPTPWYPSYADTTGVWGLTPLEDQQLAGVVMWVPGGGAYLVAALALVGWWLRTPEGSARRPRSGCDEDLGPFSIPNATQNPGVATTTTTGPRGSTSAS